MAAGAELSGTGRLSAGTAICLSAGRSTFGGADGVFTSGAATGAGGIFWDNPGGSSKKLAEMKTQAGADLQKQAQAAKPAPAEAKKPEVSAPVPAAKPAEPVKPAEATKPASMPKG